MGNNQQKTFIIWIDQNVNSDYNRRYQNLVQNYKNIEFKGFTDVEKGVNYIIENVKFHKTIIIVSGRLFPDFYDKFKYNIRNMIVIPKVIIFTGDVDKFNMYNKDKEGIKDPFFNIGGVVDNFEDLKKFVENSLNKYNPKFEGEDKDRYPDEQLKFQIIADKKDLILPMFYTEKLNHFSEEEFKQSVENLFKKIKEGKNSEPIEFLFSQIIESGNIPSCIFAKFWMRAYSTHKTFVEDMNQDLLNENYKNFLPIIQKIYETVNKNELDHERDYIYKGIYIDYEKWKPIYDSFKEKEKNIPNNMPPAILYGTSFFSFYNKKGACDEFKEINKPRKNKPEKVFLKLILEKTSLRSVKNNMYINEDISYFGENDEIVFLPFSCLGIKKMEKVDNNLYIITLCYLECYNQKIEDKDILFSDNYNIKFEEIPENDFSKLIFNSGIINEGLIKMPNWFTNTSDLCDIKTINDMNLYNQVKNICKEEIDKKNYMFTSDLRNNISDSLRNKYSGNWWVNVSDEQMKNYGMVKEDSVMIFKYNSSSMKYYIHAAKLPTE